MARQSIDIKTLKRDAFRDRMFDLIDYLDRHKKWFIAGGVAVLAVVLAITAWFVNQQFERERVAEAFYQAEKTLSDPAAATDDAKRLGPAKEALTQFLAAHPKAELSPVAWMALARIAFEEKDLDTATRNFQEAQKHPQAKPFARHLASIGLARVHEMRGEFEASAAIYRALPQEQFADLKALSLGRLALAQQKPGLARKHFGPLAKRFPPNRLSSWAADALSALPPGPGDGRK